MRRGTNARIEGQSIAAVLCQHRVARLAQAFDEGWLLLLALKIFPDVLRFVVALLANEDVA